MKSGGFYFKCENFNYKTHKAKGSFQNFIMLKKMKR